MPNNEKLEHDFMKRELERFAQSFEMLLEHSKERDHKVDAMVEKVDEMYTKVEEMYKVFNNGSFLVKVTQWGFGLLLALGGAYLMIKSIIHGQN